MSPCSKHNSATFRQAVKLQFITHCTERYSYADSVALALDGGCRWVQLRMKEASEREIMNTATRVRKLCDAYNAVFILDDYVELVPEVGADGVHLGLKDMPVVIARQLLGPNSIVGGTANTFADVQHHAAGGADYIGCGPYRFTTTKKNLSPVLGLVGYRNIVHQMQTHGITLPLVAIGGIGADDIPLLMQHGISGIALSGTILRAASPKEEMCKILNRIETNETTDYSRT